LLPTKFRIIWQNGFRREESKKSANQKQESPVTAMFVNGSGRFFIENFIMAEIMAK
jgi:hypothetical protein